MWSGRKKWQKVQFGKFEREREYNDKIKENRKRFDEKRNGISEIPFTKISQTFGLFSLLRSRKFHPTGIRASVTLGGWSVEVFRKPGGLSVEVFRNLGRVVSGRVLLPGEGCQWKCVITWGGCSVEVCHNPGRVVSGSVS